MEKYYKLGEMEDELFSVQTTRFDILLMRFGFNILYKKL